MVFPASISMPIFKEKNVKLNQSKIQKQKGNHIYLFIVATLLPLMHADVPSTASNFL